LFGCIRLLDAELASIAQAHLITDPGARQSCVPRRLLNTLAAYPNPSKFAKAAREFAVNIESNTSSRINHGERVGAGERISDWQGRQPRRRSSAS